MVSAHQHAAGQAQGLPVATRYDYIFRGTIDIASISIWFRDPVP
jgi:hypothetical protein